MVTTSSFSGSLTIPPNTAIGPVDVRVVVAYNTIPAGSGACGSYSYGETEDYVLTVIAPTAYSPTTTGVGATSAVLLWNNLGTASSYDVQWRPTGGTYTTISGITSTSYALTGLAVGTGYEWQMQPTGGSYVGPVSFTTTACTTPTSLVAYKVGSTSVQQLQWYSPNEGAYPSKTFEVQLQMTGASSWSTINAGVYTSTGGISGLGLQTGYTWRVRADCSAFSAPQTFTTTACSVPPVSAAVNIAYNSATTIWTENDFAVLYNIQYRPVGSSTWTTVPGITTQAYNFTGLSVNVAYEYAVSKVCTSTVSSAYSMPQTFTTVCSALTNPSAFPSLVSAQLNWYMPTPLGSPPGTVEVQWRPASQSAVSWQTISGIPASIYTTDSYSLTGLNSATSYQFQARRNCGTGGYSAFTSPYSFTTSTCQPPNGLFANSGISMAILSWNSTNTGFGNQPYTAQYRPASLSAGSTGWTTFSSTSLTASLLTGLDAGTAYQFQVSFACTPVESSSYSTPYTFTTLPCSNNAASGLYTADLTFGSATLNWYNSTPNTYNIQYRPKTMPVSAWSTIANAITGFGGPYSLTGLAPATGYEYQVAIACTPSQSTTYSNAASFTTTACGNLATAIQVSGITFSAANLNWTGPTTVPTTLHYRLVGGSTWIDAPAPITKPYALTGLTAGMVYEAEVASVCSFTQNSIYSLPKSFTTSPCTNQASSLTATNVLPYSAVLSWSGPPGLTYSLQYRVVGAGAWSTAGSVSSPYMLTGLTASSSYEFQVALNCGPGQLSAYSAIGIFATPSTSSCSTMYTVKDGSWDDISVWSCNRVPVVTDAVQLKHQVTIPGSYLAYALKISFDTSSKLVYGTLSRLQLNQ